MDKDTLLKLAKDADPEGAACGWCGKPNDFVDDIGWFYIQPDPHDINKACCKACWDGELGERHRNRYGLGER